MVHHFAIGSGMASVWLTPPLLAYVSGLWMAVEASTVLLNVRIFARICRLPRLYAAAGWGVLVSYPLLRLLWNPYVVSVALALPHIDLLSAPGGSMIVAAGGCFVVALSAYYYVGVILVRGKAMYTLKPHQTDGKAPKKNR